MKKFFQSSLFIGLLSVSILSCEKEGDDLQTLNTNTIGLKIESDAQKTMQEVIDDIVWVKSLHHSHSRSSSSHSTTTLSELNEVSKEEAVYYIEATLNFDYFRPVKSESDFEKMNTSTTITLNDDGLVSSEQLASVYQFFTTEIENYVPDNSSLKVLYTNVWAELINTQDIVFEMNVVFSSTENQILVIDEDDSWYPALKDGRCDQQLAGVADASDRLEELFNYYLNGWDRKSEYSTGNVAIDCSSNEYGTWINVSESTYSPASLQYGENFSQFPFKGCRSTCISESDLEKWLQDGFTCIESIVEENYSAISIELNSNTIANVDCAEEVGHTFSVSTGLIYCGKDTDGSVPTWGTLVW